ncbi:hypothetical protein NDA16_003976 [Ustilago loliicola]|nr:hypothetical protein NDA16_003976 [Ustilago loliicola]
MPPRNLPRSPFAGIGAGHSIIANLVREPSSPLRPSHQPSTSSTSTPRRLDGLPTTEATSQTLAAFSEHDFISSSVSDSLSRAFYFDVILDQAASSSSSSAGLSRSTTTSAFTSWLGDPVQDYDSDTFGGARAFDDTQAVPRSFSGSSITAVSSSSAASPSPSPALNSSAGVKPSKIDPTRLFGRVQELIDTERSYVKRIDILHQKYAIPLRTLAKDRDTAIIPLYEAQRLFGNIGEIAGANRAFLNDLERLASQGQDSLRAGLGHVLYNHMSCFSCYSEYFANFEKAKHIEQTLAKHRAFCDFADRTKYSVTGIGNTGLRDLLMEPIQRIPRYKLLIDAILAHVEPRDPLRTRLEQAITLVSRIASCEADEKTTRAAVLWSFSRNVDSFPAELISAHRRFIDCIDVDDFPLDASAASSGIAASFSGLKPIHCTLFLFDDRIAIVKRANASTSGRKLVGLDDIGRLTSQMKTFTEKSSHGALLAPNKRTELAFRGSISLMDIDAQDLGGTDLQLAFLRQPSHVTGERWTGRPLRQYVAVDPSSSTTSTHASRIHMGSSSLDADVSAKLEKMRFLESFWRAKALHKSNISRCKTRCKVVPAARRRVGSDDALPGMPQMSSNLQDARKIVYFHVHTRQSYSNETYRTPVAVSVNGDDVMDAIPLGLSEVAHPHAILDIRAVDEMEEEFAAQVRTKDAQGGEMLGQEHLLSSADLGHHIVQLSDEVDKRFGSSLRNYALSQPGTPSGSGFRQRAKAAAGLENFGRSLLFGASGAASSISSAGISNLDVFGSPRRSNSNASKSTFSSNAASISSRGMTMSTAGTSVSTRLSNEEARERPSISESETSTERGHGNGTANSSAAVETTADTKPPAPVTPARTSSTTSKSQEARRRNEAMEHGLRLVKEEMNLLRCDVEILQSSMTAMENDARTPRKRRGDDSVLKEMDVNATASVSAEVDNIHSRLKKLEFLFADVDAKWISTIRMHNRIMHDLNNAASALTSAQATRASPDPSDSAAHASLLKEKEKLEVEVSALKRKCELLTTLEADGRLENTEIHKAFNEELDMLYDHTQTPENEELAFLRKELKRTKADQHQLKVENKRLKRDLSIEQSQTETYKAALAKHGLL